MLAEATRSTTWVWVVVGGFVISLALMWHVASNAIASLPDEVRDRLRASLRTNSRPIVVTAVVLTWTLAYLLYSVAVVPIPSQNATTNLAADGTPQATDSGTEAAPVGATDPITGTVDATVAGGAPSRTGGTTRTGGTVPRTGPATTLPAANRVTLGVPQVTIKEPSLFSGAANTRGITNTTIKVCGHAPLSYGALLNTKEEDLLVFWRWLNDQGGLFGRKFEVKLVDDQYTAEGSVPAATACAEQSPFMIFGALGSDVIPPVRVWAEQKKELYLYGFTVKKGSESFKYSYTGTIQQEDLSRVIADMAVKQFPGKKVGLLWRNSANFQPGRDAFKNWVTDHGGQVVADLPVQRNQGSYTQEIISLQQKGAEVVFALEDAVTQLNIVKQGKTQQYHPQWLLFTYNMHTVTLGQDALNPPIRGANLTPAYECHQFGGSYASYADEIRTFEAAYAKYSPNTDLCGITGDLAWQGWVGFKAFAGFFELCGKDCTRNRFAGIMEGGFQGAIGAACPADFARDPHHGGLSADLMEAYPGGNNRPAFRNTSRCVKAP